MKNDIAKQLETKLQVTNGQHAYALIDGALAPEAWPVLSRRFKVAGLLPEATEDGKSAAAALPFLISIDVANATDVIRHTVDLAWEKHAATWLQSPLNLHDCANHLAHRLQGQVPDMDVLLRFADPRVLPALHHVLEPQQAKQFFAGISGWWFLERDMRLVRLVLPESGTADVAPETFAAPLVLSAAQEEQLLVLSEPDAVLALVEQNDSLALEKIPKPQRHRFIKKHMLEARKWDIESAADQALFCMIALNQSPDSLASDAWQHALQQVKSKRISLMQALEQTA